MGSLSAKEPWRPAGYGPWIAGGIWMILVLAANWVSRLTEIPANLCVLRQLTGFPCPTCRGTRAGMALLQGNFYDALFYNPLVTLGLLLFASWCVLRFFGRWQSPLHMNARWQILLCILLALAVVLNWLYVWTMESGPTPFAHGLDR